MNDRANELEIPELFTFLAAKRVSWISHADFRKITDAIALRFSNLWIDLTRNNVLHHIESLSWLKLGKDDGGYAIDYEKITAVSYDYTIREFNRLDPALHKFLMDTVEEMRRDETSSFRVARETEDECREKIEAILKKYKCMIDGEYKVRRV